MRGVDSHAANVLTQQLWWLHIALTVALLFKCPVYYNNGTLLIIHTAFVYEITSCCPDSSRQKYSITGELDTKWDTASCLTKHTSAIISKAHAHKHVSSMWMNAITCWSRVYVPSNWRDDTHIQMPDWHLHKHAITHTYLGPAGEKARSYKSHQQNCDVVLISATPLCKSAWQCKTSVWHLASMKWQISVRFFLSKLCVIEVPPESQLHNTNL